MPDMRVVAARLAPGRYVVRGGPGGTLAVCRPRKDRYGMVDGRWTHFVAPAGFTDRWTELAAVRVRRGHVVTRDGLLDAVLRAWSF